MGFEADLQAVLQKRGLELPPAAEPKGLYRPVTISGNLLFTAGHLPFAADGSLITGRVGAELSEEAGAEAAIRAGLGILASVRGALGSLDRVVRLVKTLGLVQSAPDFHAQPAVINGCSRLFADVFGPEAGIAARSAFGVGTLPLNAAVEIEAVFEIRD
ncbi:MAG: RidA family protein [Planctomycetota bacterium]|nr:MAG: RidA family protein [Planctomycetota bacterium]